MLNIAQAIVSPIINLQRKGVFQTSLKKAKQRDALIDYATSFRGKGGIYRYIEALGFTPNWQQRELMAAYDAGEPRIACRAGKGPGKCPTGDMLIFDRDAGQITVAEAVGRQLHLLSMSEDLQMEYKPATCNKSTIQACTKINTDSGNSLKISSQHKVYTQRGWVEARHVTTNDLMAVPREFDTKEVYIPLDDCTLLGYLVGDGCTSNPSSGVSFSQEDNDTLKNITRIVEAKGGEVKHISRYDYNLKRMSQFVNKHGLRGKLAKHKQIPKDVWSSGKKGMSAFLSALWECDGYVTKDGYGICLASKRLMLDIQTALASLQIYTSVRYKKSKCGDKYFDAWRLEVCGSNNLNQWVSTIGEIPGKPLIQENLRKTPNSNKDIVPIKDVEWNYIAREIGMSNNRLRGHKFRGVKHACMGRPKFEKFTEQFNYTGKYSALATSQIRWVKVTSCYGIINQQTYDVSVEDNHNFVCNNLVVHNTRITTAIFTHWSLTRPDSALIVTAPTFRQCQGVWLSEAKSIIYSSTADPRIGKLFSFVGKGYGILGAKPSEWGCQLITAISKEAFQGLHRKYIAFLEEEASGVKGEISEAIKETTTNAKGSWLHVRIGNPNSRDCAFFDSFHQESENWFCIHWNTEQTTETEYFSRRRNDEIAEEYGKTSDIYKISVLGEFPSLDPNCLISEEHLNACCTVEALHNVTKNNEDQKKQIGIDFARYGGDENVVVWRQGGILFDMWAEKTDPNNAVNKAILGQMEYNWADDDCMYCIDVSGMGEAVAGVLGGSMYMGKKVHEFYTQNTAYESTKYENKATEAWCCFAKLVKKQLVYLGEHLDKKLLKQLTSRRYIVNRKSGRIQIESKDDYMKNNKDAENGTIGKSPDRADAIVMAFYEYASESTRIAVGK